MWKDEVAERIGKSKQTSENWESGKTPIKYSDLIKLSELYEMPIEYIRIPEGDELKQLDNQERKK